MAHLTSDVLTPFSLPDKEAFTSIKIKQDYTLHLTLIEELYTGFFLF